MVEWAGLVAIGAVFVTIWGYLKWAFNYVGSFFVMTFECHGACQYAVMAYARANMKPSPFRYRIFDGIVAHIRPRMAFGFVAHETVGVSGGLFWYKNWYPVWIARTSSVAAQDDHTVNHSKPLKVTTCRLFMRQEAFILEALEFAESLVRNRPRRFSVVHHTGAGKRTMAEPRVQQSHSANHWDSVEDAERSYLGWKREEIGPPIEPDGVGSLALSQNAADFCEEVRNWAGLKSWFAERSIPWKLGALFYGKPGCGKTALVRALGQELDMPVHVFDLSSMQNFELRQEWDAVTADLPAIVLLEDIDGVFDGREPRPGVEVTFDCLLNCIDGVERTSGLLTIVTTNKPEMLDEALRNRPGRIDAQIEFEHPTEDGRRHIASRILKDWPEEIEPAVEAGDGESGAHFERRCVRIAMSKPKPKPSRDIGPWDGQNSRFIRMMGL